MNERLKALGYRPSTSGLCCAFVKDGWPAIYLHQSGRWTCDGHVSDDPIDALLTHLGTESDFWSDRVDFARKQLARVEEMESEVKGLVS